jgi:hypothetical protein
MAFQTLQGRRAIRYLKARRGRLKKIEDIYGLDNVCAAKKSSG